VRGRGTYNESTRGRSDYNKNTRGRGLSNENYIGRVIFNELRKEVKICLKSSEKDFFALAMWRKSVEHEMKIS
jgi:hypothetical protein